MTHIYFLFLQIYLLQWYACCSISTLYHTFSCDYIIWWIWVIIDTEWANSLNTMHLVNVIILRRFYLWCFFLLSINILIFDMYTISLISLTDCCWFLGEFVHDKVTIWFKWCKCSWCQSWFFISNSFINLQNIW